jgi:protein phosphatase
MGGHTDGDVASLHAVMALSRWNASEAQDDPQEGLKNFLLNAHYAIRTTIPRPIQMGTTFVIAWLIEDRAWWANVGDSRLYVLRKGVLHLLTRDQTREEFARRDRRTIPPHPGLLAQNFIFGSRGLGNDAGIRLDVGLDTGSFLLEPGDRLLLCTDGVTGWLEDAVIGVTLRDTRDPWSGAKALVEKAMEAESEDNITALLVFYDRPTLDVGATIIPSDRK